MINHFFGHDPKSFNQRLYSRVCLKILNSWSENKHASYLLLDSLADTHGVEGNFVHQLAIGRHAGGKVKFEANFVFEYTKSLESCSI